MANHLGKFTPNLAETTKALRDLRTNYLEPLDMEPSTTVSF